MFLLPAAGHQTLPKPQFAEDVHHGLHRRVIGDGEGTEVQNASEF